MGTNINDKIHQNNTNQKLDKSNLLHIPSKGLIKSVISIL